MLDPAQAASPMQGQPPQQPPMPAEPPQPQGMPPQPMMPDPAMLAQMMGQMMPPPPQKMYDCKIKRCISSGRLKVEVLPPEDFLLDPNATRIDEEKMRFIGDRSRVSRSDLKLRYPKKKDIIDELPAYSTITDRGQEKQARDSDRWTVRTSVGDKASEEIEVFELYVHVDYDGDGVAEWRQVVIAGIAGEREMLANEEWGGMTPYTDCVPNPQPHRWRGRSLFDDLEDIQKVKTVLLRQTLNNLYLTNNPLIVSNWSNIVNPDVLINRELGGNLNVKSDAASAVAVHAVPFVAKESFAALDYFDIAAEKRTGVGRSSMALDPGVLQNQTATAVQTTQDIKHTKIESYARNIAECGGLKRLFTCLLRLFVENQREAISVRLNDKWVQMDPRGWNADMDCNVNVGLGSGSRDRDLAMLQGIAQKQELVIQTLGPYNPACNVGHLFDTYRRMAEAAGLKNPEEYFPEIPEEQIAQLKAQADQQPHPEAAKVQATMQVEQMKLQSNMQLEQARMQAKAQQDAMKAQVDHQQMQAKAEIEQIQAQADIATQNKKTEAEIAMAREKFQLEAALKREEHAMKLQEMQINQQHKEREFSLRENESLGKQQMARESHQMQLAAKDQPKPEPEKKDESGGMLKDLHAAMMSWPKRVVRDKEGRISHVEPM